MSPESRGVSGTSWLGNPTDARPLFGPEPGTLLDTLRGLRPADWSAGGYRRAFTPGETLESFIHRTDQEWGVHRPLMTPGSSADRAP